MKVTVYIQAHDNNARRRFSEVEFFEFVKNSVDNSFSGYDKVAVLDITGANVESVLEKAFCQTQNVDESWVDQPSVVEKFVEGSCSSSVGDIFVVDNEAYLILSIGFKKII